MTPPRSTSRSMVYASHGYTTHDRRFMASAAEAGWRVHHARFDAGTRTLCNQLLPPAVEPCRWIGDRVGLSADNLDEFIQSFRELVVATAADLVHAGPIPTVANVAVSASPVPVIAMSWASDLLIEAPADERCAALTRSTLKGASGVITDSRHIADIAASYGADPAHIVTVPWGVDLDSTPYLPPEDITGALRLLSLRSFEPIYDLPTLLRAVALLQGQGTDQVELALAGGGPLEPDLRQLAIRLGVDSTITWIGRVGEAHVSELLERCDVHVSTALSDGTSISLLQAMATGRPSIVTDLPSNREWVEPGVNGWVFRPGDAESLAAAIREADDHRSRYRDMAAVGRGIAERRANWDLNRSTVTELYERLAK